MSTEAVSARYTGLDTWPLDEVVDAVVDRQLAATAAVAAVRPALGEAVEAMVARLGTGAGRLVYAGAGASGRLAVQDGVELLPTYGWPEARLVFLMAGGEAALIHSIEGAEDEAAAGAARVDALAPGPADVFVVVAASGRTPFALGVAEAARASGALVVGLANNPGTPLLAAADNPILLDTGPEVVAGSTRMAAGTAQKAALNALSTALMIRLGRVHDNLMADLASTNAKLDRRRAAILRRIVEVDEATARRLLDRADGHIKTAALLARGAEETAAAALLDRHAGRLRPALAELDRDGPADGQDHTERGEASR
ncbi:MAG: N-acetylmuramic acid 6-phosphate etherase [Azospirillaceae bacterium]